MTLTLSSRDVEGFVAMQRTLLAPLDYERVENWCSAVLHDAEALFAGDRSAMLVPTLEGIHYVSESIDPKLLAVFEKSITGAEPGALRFTTPILDEAWAKRRAQRIDVWTIPLLARRLGVRPEDWPTYHEHAKPAGITHGPVMTTALPTGEAFLGVASARPASARFGEKSSLAVMRMLLPSFQAGVSLLIRLHVVRAAFSRTMDALGEPIALWDTSGRKLHQTPALVAMLASEPEHDTLAQQLHEVAARHLVSQSARCRTVAEPFGAVTIRTRTASYRVYTCWAGPPLIGRDHVLIVRLERLTPALPSREALVVRHGLTCRQAQIALLLAQGLTNRAISAQLTLSPHTVRHHAEWVFNKFGVHTRKALALVMLK